MARSIWNGVISFGLVSVPVALYSATEDHEVSFHQFERDTSDRFRYKRVNERTDKEVDYADIVRGADIGGGHYVMLEQDELEGIAPGRSRSLNIEAFVDLEDIDPIYYQRTYYLGPGKDSGKTYALLRDAMEQSNKAAIARLVMRGKEYLTAVRAEKNLLVLQTMHFADEVRNAEDEIDDIPARTSARSKELKVARQLIESMSDTWRPGEYHDTYTDRVNQLIEAKSKDEEFERAEEAPDATDVVDLMDALRQSVDSSRSRGTTKKSTRRSKQIATKSSRSSKANGRKATPARSRARGKKAS
jgi:DNA end-binding protein Ku